MYPGNLFGTIASRNGQIFILNENIIFFIAFLDVFSKQNGYQKMLWELQSPNGQIGNFVDVELGDLDGDGVPELITIANLSSNDQIELLQPVLFYYKWDGQSFSENPGSMINLSGGRDFIRANNFVLFDKDGDMNQEVAISLGCPLREIIILDINISEE